MTMILEFTAVEGTDRTKYSVRDTPEKIEALVARVNQPEGQEFVYFENPSGWYYVRISTIVRMMTRGY